MKYRNENITKANEINNENENLNSIEIMKNVSSMALNMSINNGERRKKK
jgi:hypothetical protein